MDADEAAAVGDALGELLAPIRAQIAALEQRLAIAETRGIEYLGVYQRAIDYRRGSVCTHSGSLWIALEETRAVPGEGSAQWQLAAKAGRDGRDIVNRSR
jgi:hypothetical protein